jgi:NADPH:quinone reductase-like Zn-dependent oxidoreductase
MNVYPFLMRGVTIIGIDSAERELEVKEMLWNKLTNDWKFDALNYIYKEVNLEDIDAEIEKILKGQQVGKILIKI